MLKALYTCFLMLPLALPFQQAALTLAVKHDHFTTDNLGNVYLVEGAELLKYGPNGRLLARYSNLRLGDITAVDATNPLKILLYYADYQQVLFLDNQLSPNGIAISLQEQGLAQASLVCASVNNSFWVYDRRNNELVRFNENAKRITSTGNLRQVLSAEIVPAGMKEHNNYLYLICPGSGIYVFDIFGAFSKFLPLKNVLSLQVNDDLLYYHQPGRLCSYNQRLAGETCDTLAGKALSVQVSGNRIYRSYGDSLVIYPL